MPVPAPKTPSRSVTSTLDAPAAAEAPTVTLTVIWPQLLIVVELTVIPAFEKVTAAPAGKLDPAIVRESVRPCSAADGVEVETTGRDQPETSFEYVVLSSPAVS